MSRNANPANTTTHTTHERLLTPWVKVGTYIFTIHNDNYLIISDYYSRYPFIKKLPSLNVSATICATKECFSLLGIPRDIILDNRSQFQSEYNEFVKNGTLHIQPVVPVMTNLTDLLNVKSDKLSQSLSSALHQQAMSTLHSLMYVPHP